MSDDYMFENFGTFDLGEKKYLSTLKSEELFVAFFWDAKLLGREINVVEPQGHAAI